MSTTRFPPPNPADDDYIRRGDLLIGKNLFYAPPDRALKAGQFSPEDWAISVEAVYNVPAADVRPVVCCRDCKYAKMTIDGLCKCCEQFQYMSLPAWVPVTEKLPDHGWYLAYGPTIKMEVLHFHCAEEVWSSERYYNLEVTHWMPLPPPPKDKT